MIGESEVFIIRDTKTKKKQEHENGHNHGHGRQKLIPWIFFLMVKKLTHSRVFVPGR